MAKSKKKAFNLFALISLILSGAGIAMFFLPYMTYTLLGSESASGLDLFLGVFSLDNANATTFATYVTGIDSHSALAYIASILIALSLICIVLCFIISLLKVVNGKADLKTVAKLALIAVVLTIIAFVLLIIRCGQISLGTLSVGFALYTALVAMIGCGVVAYLAK